MSQNTNYETSNYPPTEDSTSSGGYGSPQNSWSDKAQRGRVDNNAAGLIDQSLNGGPIGNEIQDVKQGQDASTREKFAKESQRDFGNESGSQGLNPYGHNPDSRKDAEEMLASKYAESRGKEYETGSSAEDA